MVGLAMKARVGHTVSGKKPQNGFARIANRCSVVKSRKRMTLAMETFATPTRALLADVALKAATELGVLLSNGNEPRIDQINKFRDALHQTTEDWLEETSGHLTDASTARLYLQAVQRSRDGVSSSPAEFLNAMRSVLKDFDDIQTTRKNPESLRGMLQFALALHTLLIRDQYNRLAHWKHKLFV